MIGFRSPPDVTVALDAAAAAEPEKASRSDLIRRIVTDWLRQRGFLTAPTSKRTPEK